MHSMGWSTAYYNTLQMLLMLIAHLAVLSSMPKLNITPGSWAPFLAWFPQSTSNIDETGFFGDLYVSLQGVNNILHWAFSNLTIYRINLSFPICCDGYYWLCSKFS